jgi:hypothetical protein
LGRDIGGYKLNMRYARYIVFLLLVLLPCAVSAGEQTDGLNGFRLWQYKDAAEAYFGKPFAARDEEESVFEVYPVTESSYMVFEYWQKYPQNMYSIQITGYPTKMLPFKGLVLGDSKKKVVRALGKPDSTKKVEDPPVTINYYDDANYSVEIDADGRLYSIKLHVTNEFMSEAEVGFDDWDRFRNAVLAKDMKAILEMVRPDVEIFKDGKVIYINKRYVDFRKSPESAFVQALIGDSDSVLKELKTTEPEGEMRLAMGLGVGQVFKFRDGKILKEIVLFPYNGKYRVYEIAFKEEEDTSSPSE